MSGKRQLTPGEAPAEVEFDGYTPLVGFLIGERLLNFETQEELATRAGYSQGALASWESLGTLANTQATIDWAGALGYEVIITLRLKNAGAEQ